MRRRFMVVLSLGLLALGSACAKPVPTKVFGERITRSTEPTTATLQGVVHDSGGRPHPGARLTLDGPRHLAAVADAAGGYAFRDLPPGTYVLTVDADDTAASAPGAVRIGPTSRSSRKELTLHVGLNTVDADSGF